MKAQLSGGPLVTGLVQARAFAVVAFAGSGYNYFMGYITGRSHFFID